MYKANPNYYNGIFAVPTVITDNYLLLTSPSMLKAVLFALRHADKTFDPEFISKGTGLTLEESREALDYWCGVGILAQCDKPLPGEAKPVQVSTESYEKTPSVSEKPQQKSEERKTGIRTGRISYQQICTRLSESEEVKLLFSVAQEKLGRTIGTADQSVLLSLYDYYGLPIEVILSLCHYAAVNGKSGNTNYIFTMGANWSDREILTLEAADQEFKRLEKLNSFWTDFCSATGHTGKFPTTPQQKYLDIWRNEWSFSNSMVVYAYEEMSRHTDKMSFPYMNSILANLHSAGIKTPEEAEEYQKKRQIENEQKALKKKNGGKSSTPYGVKSEASQSPASYDLEKATENMNLNVPEYRKKEKR